MLQALELLVLPEQLVQVAAQALLEQQAQVLPEQPVRLEVLAQQVLQERQAQV